MELAALGKPFAFGRTAEVYNWGDAEVLKLYRKEYSTETILAEHRASRAVANAGIPAPKTGDIVDVGDRKGIVFEKVAGATMLGLVASRPWRVRGYAKVLGSLQTTMHAAPAPTDLPDQTERLLKKIQHAGKRLAAGKQAQVLDILSTMPKGDRLCHGDFHPDNVLITANGPVVIDWIDATRGNPLADVARTSMLMDMADLPEESSAKWLLSIFRRLSYSAYLNTYSRLTPMDPTEFRKWMIINAAARLCEEIPEEKKLVAFIESNLQPVSR